MSPEGFPMIGLNTTLFAQEEAITGPLAARHSLEHTTGELHEQLIKQCNDAQGDVQVSEKQYAPKCSFLCPVICAKTCCCCCKGSKIKVVTSKASASITEIVLPDGTPCDQNAALPTNAGAPSSVSSDMTR
tara:strand:- start:453 stop:845 length:393 start_codon:yes stop_codon:yes gene_type:complete